MKMQKFLGDLEEVCEDLKNLCTRRDQMLKELYVIGIDSKGLSRFRRYSVVESLDTSHEVDIFQENSERVVDKSEEVELSRKNDPLESTQKILKQRKKSINVSTGQSTIGMKTIKRIKQTEPKQKPKQQLPSLPLDFTVSDIITMSPMKEKEMVQYGEGREEGEIMDISDDTGITDDDMSEDSEHNQKSITMKSVDVNPVKSLIMGKPQSVKDNLPRYEDLSPSVSDDMQCVYGESGMIVSKKVAEFLERNYVPVQTDPLKENKKRKRRKRDKSLAGSVPIERQKDQNVLSVRIHTTGMVQTGPGAGRQQTDENVLTDHMHTTGMVQSYPTGQYTTGMKNNRRIIQTETKKNLNNSYHHCHLTLQYQIELKCQI